MLAEFEILGIQLKESGIPTMIGIFQVPLTKNPESSAWNPELQMASSNTIRFWETTHLPLPEPTLTLTTHLGQNVGLGEE